MQRFVLTHPALPFPVLLNATQHAAAIGAITRGETHVLLDSIALPVGHIGLLPHETYRTSMQLALKRERRYLCAFGGLHENTDTGNHDHCKRDLELTNPLIAHSVLEASDRTTLSISSTA